MVFLLRKSFHIQKGLLLRRDLLVVIVHKHTLEINRLDYQSTFIPTTLQKKKLLERNPRKLLDEMHTPYEQHRISGTTVIIEMLSYHHL